MVCWSLTAFLANIVTVGLCCVNDYLKKNFFYRNGKLHEQLFS